MEGMADAALTNIEANKAAAEATRRRYKEMGAIVVNERFVLPHETDLATSEGVNELSVDADARIVRTSRDPT